jgi:hypothetical protein
MHKKWTEQMVTTEGTFAGYRDGWAWVCVGEPNDIVRFDYYPVGNEDILNRKEGQYCRMVTPALGANILHFK